MLRRLRGLESKSVRRLHVGCGPHNLLPGWWNVDLRSFPGINAVMDVTKPWPYRNLDYVFGEHFLEHLEIDKSLKFLENAGKALRAGGRLRLSTPNLEWVVATHFHVGKATAEERLSETIAMNRAFYGWGHRFLYSREVLAHILDEMCLEDVSFHSYGESDDPELRNLERHGGFSVHEGIPSVVIVEATRGHRKISPPAALLHRLEDEFLTHVRSGH